MKNQYFLLFAFFLLQACQPMDQMPENQWYKGNLHTHSLWSDGDDFPEMIMDWYKEHGYHFIGLSDHNILQEGEKWIPVPDGSSRAHALEHYIKRFGEEWVATREDTAGISVRLKNLEDYRSLFEVTDSFLIFKSEEITDGFEGKPIHLNATNIQELIEPQGGKSVAEVMQNNIDAVMEQRESTGQPMFPHINHPNFGWAITAEDIMELENERFFEVYNGHPAVHNYGDSTRQSTEQMWDQINAHYLRNSKPLLFGIATDDSHNYHDHGPTKSNSGRGWVMVQAPQLRTDAIIEAMEDGHFYASTGVSLQKIQTADSKYSVEVDTKPGVNYTIQFWGVKENGEQGEILAEEKGSEATYNFTGEELFVRAKIISDELQPNPFKEGDVQKAWTQPVTNLTSSK